ncbi:MAG: 30S ribosomal protein S16 [Ignavibacteria bacterium GWB2_35_6b]|nr:MAG: 30S ribosomal protein S16 [Ignavibacteria bacterium GWB2_35_6b]
MAVKLRLRRMGKKKQPVYKVVAADVRSPRDGKFIEAIGLYNPKANPAVMDIQEDRALYWLGVGAQPTETVKNILSKKGILLKKDLQKLGKSEEEINAKIDEWVKLQEAKKASKQSKKKDLSAAAEVKKPEVKAEEKTEKETEGAEEV